MTSLDMFLLPSWEVVSFLGYVVGTSLPISAPTCNYGSVYKALFHAIQKLAACPIKKVIMASLYYSGRVRVYTFVSEKIVLLWDSYVVTCIKDT